MSKRDEFITVIRTLKAASPTITDKQRIGLLQQATQNYGLSAQEATEILKDLDLVVGEEINYFDVLGFSIEEIQSLNENAIVNLVEAAHKKRYSASLRAGGRIRSDGKTEEQWRTLLNQARDALIDAKRRREHINALEHDEADIPVVENVDTIFKSPDIPETTIQELSHNGVTSDVDMVFIPAGEFQMGSRDEKASDSEKPIHTVYVDAFYMDKYLVTNEQYKAFLDENPQWRKPQLFKDRIPTAYHDGAYLNHWDRTGYPKGEIYHPVTKVGWYAAMAYAQWIGKRLPTEAEWEKAARGGLEGKQYPWGNTVNLNEANYAHNARGTTPVGRYPANGYGLHDMSGNVWEWCLDAYDTDFYLNSPRRNPFSGTNSLEWVTDNFRSIQSSRVLRGGSWLMDPQGIRVAYRFSGSPSDTHSAFGFRCVKPVTP
ncbi:MAG: formylglycine-generating enzyme family protein [Candidatus Poribacteria bacterium]|nr:formylglycine-generating enzyme family protein [Candidatus Poribacteria bacterium]